MIRVAIADDSAFIRRLLAGYVEQVGDCQVIGTAHDAPSTLALVRASRPDVLTLDLDMPGASGLTLLQQVVNETRTPVVVVSGVTRRAAATTLRALEIGAVDFVLKYTPGAPVRPDALRREIVAKVRVAAAAFPNAARGAAAIVPVAVVTKTTAVPHRQALAPPAPRVIVIGASTGGPRAVRDLLSQLPPDFATPCIVVQHLPPLFTGVFAAELGRHVRLPVLEAVSGDHLEPGRAVVAPGGSHLLLRAGGRLDLQPPARDDIHRPSIDVAMSSAADSYGRYALGVVLTGMGSDGAEGLLRIRECGGAGYVQDPGSCVVASMPSRALERAGADYVAPPDRIGHRLALRRTA